MCIRDRSLTDQLGIPLLYGDDMIKRVKDANDVIAALADQLLINQAH